LQPSAMRRKCVTLPAQLKGGGVTDINVDI
jgi:hypothetical protein